MIDLQYLQNLVVRHTVGNVTTGIPDITDAKQVFESAAGFDGIVAAIQQKGKRHVIVLEHDDMGFFYIEPGSMNEASQTIWIMEMVGGNDDSLRRPAQQRCFNKMKQLIGIMNAHRHDPQLEGWRPEERDDAIGYICHNAGPNYTGYEVTFRFREYIDLSDDGTERSNG